MQDQMSFFKLINLFSRPIIYNKVSILLFLNLAVRYYNTKATKYV